MKILFLTVLILSSISLSFAQGGYRCEGYCGGIDANNGVFYDLGYLKYEYPDSAQQSYVKLLKKCEKLMPAGVQPRIYKNVEVTKEERKISEYWKKTFSGQEMFFGYRWVQINSINSSSSYSYSERYSRWTIKVDSMTSRESCQYDEKITTPYYEGDLPVQG